MTPSELQRLAEITDLPPERIIKTVALLDDGATVPFIARYRKEVTGGMDEIKIIQLRDALEVLRKLNQRRVAVMDTLREREILTDELETAFNAALTMDELEDLYLPYKVKRKTRAVIAREKGLVPVAEFLLAQKNVPFNPECFINPALGVTAADDVMQGAMDIVAEAVSEDGDHRGELRELFRRRAVLEATVVKARMEEAAVFKDYFDYAEPFGKIPSHRALAVLRGRNQDFLTVKLRPDKAEAVGLLLRRVVIPLPQP